LNTGPLRQRETANIPPKKDGMNDEGKEGWETETLLAR